MTVRLLIPQPSSKENRQGAQEFYICSELPSYVSAVIIKVLFQNISMRDQFLPTVDSHPAIDLSDFPILSSRSSATPNPMPSTRNYGEPCYYFVMVSRSDKTRSGQNVRQHTNIKRVAEQTWLPRPQSAMYNCCITQLTFSPFVIIFCVINLILLKLSEM